MTDLDAALGLMAAGLVIYLWPLLRLWGWRLYAVAWLCFGYARLAWKWVTRGR